MIISKHSKVKAYVSNTDKDIFVLKNLPEVIKGALFSRYSRSTLGIRELLEKEFLTNKDIGLSETQATTETDRAVDTQKANDFYDRILDGYGDDSIGELGGAHVALENISMIAAKHIQDSRIGGSPLEKSTRYVRFDQKVNGKYKYYREPVIMNSDYAADYEAVCDQLFETYTMLQEPMTSYIQSGFPKPEGYSTGAYNAALRAKVLDSIRGLLPAATLTNMGIYGNGRFYEYLIQKCHKSLGSEIRSVGLSLQSELSTSIPSFIRRADQSNKHYLTFSEHTDHVFNSTQSSSTPQAMMTKSLSPTVQLIHHDSHAISLVMASLMFPYSDQSISDLMRENRQLSPRELQSKIKQLAEKRTNRRHKLPRAFENINYTFEITADYGVYRDLQRHRILTQDKQYLSTNVGYYIPTEISDAGYLDQYQSAIHNAFNFHAKVNDLCPFAAQYVLPMATNIRWYFTINLRSLLWLTELRSTPAGHPQYRDIAQQMATCVQDATPYFDCLFSLVDFSGQNSGRLNQEQNKENKKQSMA